MRYSDAINNLPKSIYQKATGVLRLTGILIKTKSKLGLYVQFNSQGHTGTGPQLCHLWDSNPQR